MSEERDRVVDAAIAQAADECGLAPVYRRTVRPLVADPEGRWPQCCGEGCAACVDTRVATALRALELLGTPRRAPV